MIDEDERDLLARADHWLADHRDEFERNLARWVAVPSICTDDCDRPDWHDDADRCCGGGADSASDAHTGDAGFGEHAPEPLGAAVARMFALAAADLRDMGLVAVNHGGYAMSAAVEGGLSHADLPVGGDDEIALVGHLDVVPAGDGWTRPPFELTREGEFVFGRGVQDCKGPSLVNVFVLRMIRDLGVPLRHRVRALFGGGEETIMNDLRGYLRLERPAGFSLVTDGPFPVNYGQKGVLGIAITMAAPGIWAGFHAGSAANAVPGEASIALPRGMVAAESHISAASAQPATLTQSTASAASQAAAGVVSDAVADAIARAPKPYRDALRWDAASGVLHAEGIAGHAAFQDGTLNAIMLLAGFLAQSGLLRGAEHADELVVAQTLYEIAAAKDGEALGIACADESGALSFNLGCVDAADAVDSADSADHADCADRADCSQSGIRLHLACDSRYPVSKHGDDIIARLRAAIDAMPRQAAIRIEQVRDEPAYHIDPNGIESTTLTAAFNDFFDADKQPFTMGGGTHSRMLPRSVTFGADFWYMDDIARKAGHPAKPGGMGADEGGAHAADECVNIDNLLTAAKLYLLALVRLDRTLAASPTDNRETACETTREAQPSQSESRFTVETQG